MGFITGHIKDVHGQGLHQDVHKMFKMFMDKRKTKFILYGCGIDVVDGFDIVFESGALE